ncbi:MAG: hypothetical protein IPL59_08450 [Candidatus Competibacteraceae bacterium]|nr:hypothetical protein [Candidatus Competibacteraceae bacterium]
MLAGFGFQLRGQAQLPPEMAADLCTKPAGLGVPPGVLSLKLQQTLLANNGVTVTRDPDQATATLTILREAAAGARWLPTASMSNVRIGWPMTPVIGHAPQW